MPKGKSINPKGTGKSRSKNKKRAGKKNTKKNTKVTFMGSCKNALDYTVDGIVKVAKDQRFQVGGAFVLGMKSDKIRAAGKAILNAIRK